MRRLAGDLAMILGILAMGAAFLFALCYVLFRFGVFQI